MMDDEEYEASTNKLFIPYVDGGDELDIDQATSVRLDSEQDQIDFEERLDQAGSVDEMLEIDNEEVMEQNNLTHYFTTLQDGGVDWVSHVSIDTVSGYLDTFLPGVSQLAWTRISNQLCMHICTAARPLDDPLAVYLYNLCSDDTVSAPWTNDIFKIGVTMAAKIYYLSNEQDHQHDHMRDPVSETALVQTSVGMGYEFFRTYAKDNIQGGKFFGEMDTKAESELKEVLVDRLHNIQVEVERITALYRYKKVVVRSMCEAIPETNVYQPTSGTIPMPVTTPAPTKKPSRSDLIQHRDSIYTDMDSLVEIPVLEVEFTRPFYRVAPDMKSVIVYGNYTDSNGDKMYVSVTGQVRKVVSDRVVYVVSIIMQDQGEVQVIDNPDMGVYQSRLKDMADQPYSFLITYGLRESQMLTAERRVSDQKVGRVSFATV